MRRKTFICTLLCVILCTSFSLYAKEYSMALIALPTTDDLVKLFTTLVEASGNTLQIQIVPAARAKHLIESKQVDFMFPATVGFDPQKDAMLKFDFSGAIISKNVMVLYMNKNKAINIPELKQGNPSQYHIETPAELMDLYEFTPNSSSSLEGSLQRVNNGIVDGFLFSQLVGDMLLRKMELKNIKRQLYGTTQITFALQKGAKGGDVDKMLMKGLDIIKKNGKYEQLNGKETKILENYDNWQP